MASASLQFCAMGFPARYVQGRDALSDLKNILQDGLQATSPLVIYDAALSKYLPRFHQPGLIVTELPFPGNCSEASISALTDTGRQLSVDCVIGFGGGKTLDTAKAVASNLRLPMVIMPSAASSDAPTSRLVAVYEDHVFKYSRVLERNPDLVLVDTSIMVEAPKRLLAAGIGDALSKKFEVAHSVSCRVPNTFGMQSLLLCNTLAERCYEIIKQHATKAMSECESKQAGDSFEYIVEACVLYSGLSFEGGGLSLAHGLLRGLTRIPQTDHFLHGELVAYGTLVQVLACPAQRHEFADVFDVIKTIGLPSSLRDFGVHKPSVDLLQQIANQTLIAPYLADGAQAIHSDDIVQAMLELERRTA